MMALGSTSAAQAQKLKCKTLGIKGSDGVRERGRAGAYLGATQDQRFKSKLAEAKTPGKPVALLDVTADVSGVRRARRRAAHEGARRRAAERGHAVSGMAAVAMEIMATALSGLHERPKFSKSGMRKARHGLLRASPRRPTNLRSSFISRTKGAQRFEKGGRRR